MSRTATSTLVNFSQYEGLSTHYSTAYARVLDNVFTPSECATLLSLAINYTPTATETELDHPIPTEAASNPYTNATDNPPPPPRQLSGWKPAGLSTGATQTVHTNFRNSDRIIVIDETTSKWVYERLKPLVEDEIGRIQVGGEWDGITGRKGRTQGPTWEMVGINPRLSFLRYEPGHYFKPHYDGLNDLTQPDGTVHKSFVTLHLYLNGEEGEGEGEGGSTTEFQELCANDPPERLVGGSTRFWTPNKKHFLDVRPRTGRVLVFQQRILVHSGEEVTEGVKYTMRSDFMYRQV